MIVSLSSFLLNNRSFVVSRYRLLKETVSNRWNSGSILARLRDVGIPISCKTVHERQWFSRSSIAAIRSNGKRDEGP